MCYSSHSCFSLLIYLAERPSSFHREAPFQAASWKSPCWICQLCKYNHISSNLFDGFYMFQIRLYQRVLKLISLPLWSMILGNLISISQILVSMLRCDKQLLGTDRMDTPASKQDGVQCVILRNSMA